VDVLDFALLILRLAVGLTFAAHGAQKLFGWWGGSGWDGWRGVMAKMGFRPVLLFAALSALTEFGGGLFLALGLGIPIVASAFMGLVIVILAKVHLRNGFFVSKSGIEFPFNLGIGALVIGLLGPGRFSIDAAVGITPATSLRIVLLLLGAGVGLLTLLVPRLATREAAPT
jgi:putative oxidoreductase